MKDDKRCPMGWVAKRFGNDVVNVMSACIGEQCAWHVEGGCIVPLMAKSLAGLDVKSAYHDGEVAPL